MQHFRLRPILSNDFIGKSALACDLQLLVRFGMLRNLLLTDIRPAISRSIDTCNQGVVSQQFIECGTSHANGFTIFRTKQQDLDYKAIGSVAGPVKYSLLFKALY